MQVKTVQFYFKMFNWYKNYNVLAVSVFLSVWFTHVVQVHMVNS